MCKARTPEHGTVELFLEGNGPVRKGFLRTTVPSGMVHVQTVRAERYDDLLVADDVLSTDLVVHAATLRRRGAAQEIKLGEWKQRWSTCE